jgi:hypothetical protein
MAKAIVPLHRFREKFGETGATDMTALLHALVAEFLQHETARLKVDGRSEAEEIKAR